MKTQRKGRSSPLVSVAGGAVLLALAVVATLSIPALIAQPGNGNVVLEYTHIHEMLAEQDPIPLLRVYDDGTVRVHYPAYMSRAGDYELQLSKEELRQLFVSLRMDGVADLDLISARAARDAAEQALSAASGETVHVSDATHTVIQLVPTQVPGLSAEPGAPTADRTIRWTNVHTDARFYPNLAPVQAIASAEQRLQLLINRAVETQ